MAGSEFLFIGEPELLAGFRFAGVDGVACLGRDEGLAAFESAKRQGCQVVIFSQDIADLLRAELNAWQIGGGSPLVVELPPLCVAVAERKSLVQLIRQAIGIPV